MSPSGLEIDLVQGARSIGSVTRASSPDQRCVAAQTACQPTQPGIRLCARSENKSKSLATGGNGTSLVCRIVILETRGLTKEFRGFTAVQGVGSQGPARHRSTR